MADGVNRRWQLKKADSMQRTSVFAGLRPVAAGLLSINRVHQLGIFASNNDSFDQSDDDCEYSQSQLSRAQHLVGRRRRKVPPPLGWLTIKSKPFAEEFCAKLPHASEQLTHEETLE